MKRFISAAIAAIISAAVLCSCTGGNGGNSHGSSLPDESSFISILTDKKFKKGFNVRGLGIPIYRDRAEEETFGDMYETGYVFDYGGDATDEPVWDVCQWSSRYAFHDRSITEFISDKPVYTYKNKSKLLSVNTSTGEFTLGLKGSECYVYGDRQVGQEWPHLLISRDIGRSELVKISDKEEIRITLKATLDSYEDHMTVTPHEGIHAAQCMFYLYVANYDKATNNFNDMLWLGMPVFDNRVEYTAEFAKADVDSKESETGKYIYNVASDNYLWEGNNFYKNGEITVGTKASIDFDILPFVKTALEKAQTDGYMQTASYDNLYINGMYIGFELPGTYDIQMTFSDMDIKVL